MKERRKERKKERESKKKKKKEKNPFLWFWFQTVFQSNSARDTIPSCTSVLRRPPRGSARPHLNASQPDLQIFSWNLTDVLEAFWVWLFSASYWSLDISLS